MCGHSSITGITSFPGTSAIFCDVADLRSRWRIILCSDDSSLSGQQIHAFFFYKNQEHLAKKSENGNTTPADILLLLFASFEQKSFQR
jgi:hypothetical protein